MTARTLAVLLSLTALSGLMADGPGPSAPPPLPPTSTDPGSPGLPSGSQGAGPSAAATSAPARVITLAQALDAALGNDDVQILEANLAAARAQHALNLSRNEPTLAASGAWGATDGFNDQTLAKSAGASGVGLGQSLQGSLSFVDGQSSSQNSGTRLGLSATQNLPVSPQDQTSSTGKTISVAVPPTTSIAFTLSQAVWDGYPGGQAKATVDKSLLALKGKELAARQARSAAAAKVKQAYVTALTAQRTLALRLSIQDKQDAIQKQIEATYALKQASLIDLETARINAATAALDVETSRHDWALASQRLANLMGLAPDTTFAVAEIDSPSLPAASLDEALAAGLAARVDVAQADLAARSSDIDAVLAAGSGQPTLTATGGLAAALKWDTSVSAGESASLGLRISLPLLDAGAAQAQLSAAQGAAAASRAQAVQLRKSIAADIRDAWWTVDLQSRRVDLARRSADLAQSQLALVKAQNSFGTATTQDLLTASVNSANAEATWLAARGTWLLAVLALETAMGR